MKFVALTNIHSQKKRCSISLIIFFSFSILLPIFAACKMNEQSGSTDLDALNKIIKLEPDLKIIRWEVFATPEYQGGVPGPTDYISLVIEIENFVTSETSQSSSPRLVWIAPEAARPWMTKESRLFFEKFKNKTVDITSQKNCISMSARSVKMNKKIDGIACRNSLNSFLYFVLADYTS